MGWPMSLGVLNGPLGVCIVRFHSLAATDGRRRLAVRCQRQTRKRPTSNKLSLTCLQSRRKETNEDRCSRLKSSDGRWTIEGDTISCVTQGQNAVSPAIGAAGRLLVTIACFGCLLRFPRATPKLDALTSRRFVALLSAQTLIRFLRTARTWWGQPLTR